MVICREILTIQIGHQANHVGTHYWNLQAYQEDTQVLYRNGLNSHGQETTTPRTLILDLKGSLSIQKNALYPEADSVCWDGKATKVEQEISSNAYLDSLDNPTTKKTYSNELMHSTSWTDYNHSYFHPRSIVELPMFTHGSTASPFARHSQGVQAFGESQMMDDLVEGRLRAYMEEAQSPQGFQLFVTPTDGFSGIATSLVSALEDEYPKKARLIFGIIEPNAVTPGLNSNVRNANLAQSMAGLALTESLYVPLYAPFAQSGPWSKHLKPFSTMYEWSGYLASAIETATLPCRLLGTQRQSLEDIVSLINRQNGASLGGLAHGLPVTPDFYSTKSFDPVHDLTLDQTDSVDLVGFPHAALTVTRGAFGETAIKTVNEYADTFRIPHSQRALVQSLLNLPPCFPQFFTGLDENGKLLSSGMDLDDVVVEKVPGYTRLHSGTTLGKLIKQTQSSIKTLARLDPEFDVIETIETLDCLYQCYDPSNL